MRRIIGILFAICVCLTSFAQITFQTGDVQLEADLNLLNTNAKKNMVTFRLSLVNNHGATKVKIAEMEGLNMGPADIFMAYQLANLSHKPIDVVVKSYKGNKKKGWGAIAKSMGINLVLQSSMH